MAIMSVRSVAENSLLQAMIHKAGFLLKLRFFHFLKLLLRNQALYRPMQRQVAQGELAPRALHGNVRSILPSKEWTKWRKSLRVQGKTPQKASLTVVKQAASVRSAKQSQKAATACSSTSSRTPAKKRMPVLPKAKAVRRTPFRLRVMNPIVCPGRRSQNIG